MFDIAWSELLVIVVVAVVVVGPKDLPRLMRSVGQWAGKARAMADQFRRSFDDMARQSELDDLRREVQKLQQSPMSDKDYESFGIKDSDFPTPSKIEDVGASPVATDPAPLPPPPPDQFTSGAPAPSPEPVAAPAEKAGS
jgi:sec-independent protein translocase protein TatB